MGWFWNDSTSSGSKAKDPFHRLDPEIREYLLRESPLKLAPTSSTSSTSPTSSISPKTPETDSPEESKPTATPSKYGDRYADIWAQYQPQGAEEAAKSSQEQLSDIIQAYKWRKGAIGRAALENCANEQFELHQCYKRGSFKERMTTCSKYNHRLQDCYTTQSNFLRALGYMSDFTRDPVVDEKIQMHADKLYQEQLAQDKAAKEASKSSSSEVTLSDPPQDKETVS